MSYNITKATVIGAGVMGSGIAGLLAAAGIEVRLLDIVPKELTAKEKSKGITESSKAFRNRFATDGLKNISKMLHDKSHKNLITVGNIEDNLKDISDSDWIIEVVIERLDVKVALMENIAKYRKKGSIVGSNTSGIPVKDICAKMDDEFKAHFLGTHFFNPPRFMKLFEIIPTENTSQEVIDYLTEFSVDQLGKGSVQAKDTPNFIGNRIGTFAVLSSIKLMEKYNLTIGEVDALTGPVIGRPKTATFKTLDLVGLDTVGHVAKNMYDCLEGEEKELFATPEIITTLIEKGFLGNKTRGGFYKKDKKRNNFVWDKKKSDYVEFKRETLPEVKEALKSKNKFLTMVTGDEPSKKYIWETLKEVLVYSATKIPEIADDFKLIDDAMKWGYNWEKGPFEIWDTLGVKETIERMEKEGEVLPKWIDEIKERGYFYDPKSKASKYIDLSKAKFIIGDNFGQLLDLGDGVAYLELLTKGSTLNAGSIEFIGRTLDEIESNSNYKGLVFGSRSGNFGLGADLQFVAESVKSGNIQAIDDSITVLTAILTRMKYFKKPIVAAVSKMALGGGCEVAMHSSFIVASSETYMGLVELGVGLIPGGGGCKELTIRALAGKDKEPVATRSALVKDAWETIAMAKVSGSGFNAKSLGFLKPEHKVVMNEDSLIDVSKDAVLTLVKNNFKPQQKVLINVPGKDGLGHIQYFLNAMASGGFVSEYDRFLATKLAHIMTGGDLETSTMVSEEYLFKLEKEAFLELVQKEKTQDRIMHMLTTGKPLRN